MFFIFQILQIQYYNIKKILKYISFRNDYIIIYNL